jgi:hypothetical protein
MKTIALVALVGIAAVAFLSYSSGPSTTVETQFRDFLETYRVGYGNNDEYNFRLSVFADNLKTIERLNLKNPRATFAVNKFADRTPSELKVMRGFNGTPKTPVVHVAPKAGTNADWINLWEQPKDQGQCGSCWAFSAVAAFESRYHLAKGSKKVETLFAEQQVVDCDTQSQGCNGGWMDYAFEYLQGAAGVCTEDEYVYEAYDQTCDDQKCTTKPEPAITGFKDIPAGNENALLAALVDGPVSVAVDANNWSFYSSGIFDDCGTDLDHGVTLVKSSHENKYVTIRNSWGSGWGEEGHIRISLGSNTCGYANVASYPTFE